MKLYKGLVSRLCNQPKQEKVHTKSASYNLPQQTFSKQRMQKAPGTPIHSLLVIGKGHIHDHTHRVPYPSNNDFSNND